MRVAIVEGSGTTVAARTASPIPLGASLMALGAGVVWSFGAIVVRKADGADAFQYLVWRSVGIIIVLEVAARVRRRPPLTPAAFRSGPLMLVTCACLLVASICFVYALKTTTPANAAFLASITPLVAVLLARIVLREALTAVTIVAVAVAFVGLCITVAGDLEAGNLTGNVAALLSAVGIAGYTICVRADQRRDWSPALPGYAVAMIVICAAITLANGRPLVPPLTDVTLAMFHGGVFIVVGTLLFNHASRQVPAVAMAVFAQTEMVFVPVWALFVLDDLPTTTSLIGGVIITVAVLGKALLDARRTVR